MTLVERLRIREASAFSEAYALHGPALYNFLRRLCSDRDLAADMYQETWVQLVRHAPRLRPDSNLGAWLCVVGRNAFRKHRRFVLVDGERLRALRWTLTETTADGRLPAVDDVRLECALGMLAVSDREILLLHASADGGQEQLAEALGLRYTVFRQRLSRARQRLAHVLRKEIADE